MPDFGVTPGKMKALLERMEDNGLREEDLRERFVSSGGPGGQKVNRSATCVVLLHVLSGIQVKAQQTRSQALNRYYARQRLCELMEARELGDESPEAKEAEKIRKQKARRRRRTKKKL